MIGNYIGMNWYLGGEVKIPEILKNLVYYFDKDLSTVTDTGTMSVEDLSLLNEPATNTVNKPTFSVANGLTYTGSQQLNIRKRVISGERFTIYLRINRPTNTDDRILEGDPASVERYFILTIRATLLVYLAIGSGKVVQFTGLTTDQLIGDHLYRIDNDGANLHLHIDGVLTHTIPNTGGLFNVLGDINKIGNSTFHQINGSIKQLMIYNEFLDAEKTALVENQLANPVPINNQITFKPFNAGFQTGQSNGEGREELIEYLLQNQNFSNAKITSPSGLIYDINKTDLANPNYRGFEIEYSRLFNNGLVVIKYCVGGTPLGLKTGTELSWNVNNAIRYNLTEKAKLYWTFTIDYYKSIGYSLNKAFSLRMQGCHDASVQADALAFKQNLKDWINNIRAFVGYDIPHIEMRIKFPDGVYRNEVRTAQFEACHELPNCYMIDTDTYSLQVDNIHYDVAGYLQGGQDIHELITYNNLL